MKTLVVALGVLLVGVASLANAQETFVERVQDLDLTDQQEAMIADIQKECQPKVQKAAEALRALAKEEVDQIHEVLTAEQKQKAQALREERGDRANRKERRENRRENRRDECLPHTLANLEEVDLTEAEMAKIEEFRSEFRPQIAKAIKELEGLLTADQKRAREEALASGQTRREMLQALKLTDAQKEKVTSAGKDLRAAVRGELEQIQSLLTTGQAEKVQELKNERKEQVRDRTAYRIANFKDLNLTEEQATKIANIRQEYRPRIQEAGNSLRAAARDAVSQVVAVIKG
jgi:Spy/CpxP family protein refolding chaperone